MIFEALLGELRPLLHGQQPVLREAVFAFFNNILSNLFANLFDIGAGNDADMDAFVHQSIEGLDHFRLDTLSGGGQRLIDVKQCNHFFFTVHIVVNN